MNIRQQPPISGYDEEGTLLGDIFADLLVENERVLELKAVRPLADEPTTHVLGYLRALRLEHAMLVNFGAPVTQFKKFIFNEAFEPKQ